MTEVAGERRSGSRTGRDGGATRVAPDDDDRINNERRRAAVERLPQSDAILREACGAAGDATGFATFCAMGAVGIGSSGRLGKAHAELLLPDERERLFDELGVFPGAVTPLSVINNKKKIRFFNRRCCQ